MDIAVQKKQLRVVFCDKRKEVSKAKQIIDSIKFSRLVECSLLSELTNKRIALFASTRSELNLYKVACLLKMRGNQIFLPLVKKKDYPLVFCQAPVSNWRLLPRKYFNIPEPVCRRDYLAKQLDVIFTPLVAFDSYANRLGMGGGFYDRTLAANIKKRFSSAPITIGVGYDFQRYNGKLPTEETDFRLDAVMTPSYMIFEGGV